jgi:hypothetical protein
MVNKIKNQNGFTLVEIISFIGLTTLLLFLTYNILVLTSRSSSNGSAITESLENGKIFLDKITTDLRQTTNVITILPIIDEEKISEIVFQDPNSLDAIKYSRYYLDNTTINKQTIVYYFSDQPDVFVNLNARDDEDNPPLSMIENEEIIANNISELGFYGDKLINIDLKLSKNNKVTHLFTSVFIRNDQ